MAVQLKRSRLFEQVVDVLEQRIRDRELVAGSELPSERQLMAEFGHIIDDVNDTREWELLRRVFTEDAVFYDPLGGVFRGRDEIDGIAAKLKAIHPDFQYQPLGKPEEVGNAGRVRWIEGKPGEKPEVAGTDFIITRDGRIAAIYLFFDKMP